MLRNMRGLIIVLKRLVYRPKHETPSKEKKSD